MRTTGSQSYQASPSVITSIYGTVLNLVKEHKITVTYDFVLVW